MTTKESKNDHRTLYVDDYHIWRIQILSNSKSVLSQKSFPSHMLVKWLLKHLFKIQVQPESQCAKGNSRRFK